MLTDSSLSTTVVAASVPVVSSLSNISHQLTVKLDSTNFLLWKTQFLPMVIGCGLEHHLDQISEGVLPQLVGATTAKAAWNKLVSTYASGSKAQIRDLMCAKGIADRLAALQHPVSDEELIKFVVAGLGPTYRLFGRMLECRTNDCSFDDLYGMLLTEERRLKREEEATVISPSVQYSKFSSFSLSSSSCGHGRGRDNRGRGQLSILCFKSKSWFSITITIYSLGYFHNCLS
ncbi:uncharacterized protein LOC131170614 [Hevea brasiliensis]|uniref:uncharacterized protein LOC131170614 n=1 Tax=Hevea brasiliensis TaxID=3981 RepID=UPI0025EC05A9|nr:uncharacterized protein LOC131170614 [Hevea brasiliensis]